MLKWVRATFSLCYLLACVPGLLAQSLSKPPANPDFSQEALVFEQVSTKVTFENDGTSERETSVRARVQSAAGVQRFGLLTFPYQASVENLEISYVRVRKPDGTTVLTPTDNMQDMASQITREAPLYSDLREKQVAVKGLGVGDVVEYKPVWHLTKPLAPGQFWYAYDFMRDGIVLQEELAISVPSGRQVTVKSSEVKPVLSESGKYRVYTWTTSNLEQKPKEDENKTAVQRARGRFPAAAIELSSFQSWDEVGRWYGNLQQERIKPTPEIQAKAAELTKGATDDNAKLHAIYNYVSTQFRYIGIDFGIGRYQPHSAAEVLSNQYGDCKDKHTLLAALLEAAGIKAYPALISASHQLDPEVPSPGQFDHVISVVPQGNSFLWLDTTPEVAPFGYLLPPLRDKSALLIADAKPAALVSTPAKLPFPETQVIKIDGKLDDAGTLNARFDRTDHGDIEVLMRSVLRRVPQTQWKDVVQNVSYASGFGGTVSDVTAGPPEDIDVPFHFSYTYTRTKFGGDWEHHRITPPVPLLLLPGPSDDNVKPKAAIWLGSPHRIQSESRLELPAGYAPELPRNVAIKRDFAEYHSSYEIHSRALFIKLTFESKLPEVPVEQYESYRSMRKAIEDDRDQYIQLATGPQAMANAARSSRDNQILDLPDSENPEAQKAEEEATGGQQSSIDALKRAVAADPKFVRGWVMLGQDYGWARQPDLAVDAYRHAIAADSSQRLPYKLLGFALMASRKYDEAVEVWKSLIAFAPDDRNGPANLASALFQLRRYADAASAYELAINQGQHFASLEAALGKAYLRAGNQEKAWAAFQKAMELEPGDATENEIAYELAEANMKLPEALDYAQKAVRSVEEASQKVTLSDLNVEDLQRMNALSACWDTLGWVYFKMGNLDQAEKYLNAAWTLSQGPVEGEHLGQVYEQQHKKEAAVHTYQLALAASTSALETSTDSQEIQSRLSRLGGGSTKGGYPGTSGGAELSQMRTTKLSRVVQGSASAEFFVMLSSGPKFEDVKFISGSEELRSAGKALTSAKFDAPFPDSSSAHMVRRGILSCFSVTGCSFVVYPLNLVHSVN